MVWKIGIHVSEVLSPWAPWQPSSLVFSVSIRICDYEGHPSFGLGQVGEFARI